MFVFVFVHMFLWKLLYSLPFGIDINYVRIARLQNHTQQHHISPLFLTFFFSIVAYRVADMIRNQFQVVIICKPLV